MIDKTMANDIEIYVVSHGYHSGIVLPRKHIKVDYLINSKKLLEAKYLEFGFGDMEYYMSNNPSTIQGIRALLWPTESVMQVVKINKDLKKTFPESKIYRLKITKKKLRLLNEFIFRSFKTQNKKKYPIGKSFYLDGYFYEGHQDFYIFNTCNTWVAKALKVSGYDINPYFIFTQCSLERSLLRIAEQIYGSRGN